MPFTPGTVNYPGSLDSVVSLFEAANNSQTTISSPVGSGDATINVVSTTLFSSTGSIVIENEIIYYTGKSGTTFTGCIRGQAGTSAASHSSGLSVYGRVLAQHHNTLATAIVAIETLLEGITANRLLSFAGPTSARVATVPDASFSVARIDAGQTFIGTQIVRDTLNLGVAGANTGTIALGNSTGANTSKIRAGASPPDLTYVWPVDTPTNGEQLTANISGSTVTLSWDAAGSGGGGGDAVSVNGAGATDANFLDVAGSAGAAGTTWSLNTGATPDDITLAVAVASASVAGVVTANSQTLGGLKTFSGGIRSDGFGLAVVVKSAPYTLTAADSLVICDTATTLTLPALATAVQSNRSLVYLIRNASAGDVIVDGSGSEQIEGDVSIVVTSGSAVIIAATATQWYVFAA